MCSHSLIQDTFPPLEGNLVLISRPSALPLHQLLATTNPLPVPTDLPVLDVSYKWTQTLCGLLCLASFITGIKFSRFVHVSHESALCSLLCCAVCLAAQSRPTLCNPMDCSPPHSSVHGDSPGKNTEVGWPYPPPGDRPNPGIKFRSLTLWADPLLPEPPGKPCSFLRLNLLSGWTTFCVSIHPLMDIWIACTSWLL